MFLKKITILSTIFFFLGASNVFAATYDIGTDLTKTVSPSQQAEIDNALKGDPYVSPQNTSVTTPPTTINDGATKITPNSVEEAIQLENRTSNSTKSSAPQFSCEGGKDALCSEKFTIDTKLFSPGGTGLNKSSSKDTINGFMTTLIKKLMVALGSLALLIMVVGAGFMMFAMGKDDNLNKGKTIFKAGIIALVIALSSYFMVSFLSYILYS